MAPAGWLWTRGLALLGLLALMGTVPSCAKKSRHLPVFPAKGQLIVDGKAAKGAFVYLWPDGIGDMDAYCPNGQTEENGDFVLSTYDAKDGAPAGEYAVTVEWPERFNPISNRWEGDKLKGRFSDPKTSKIRRTIAKKPNELAPIELSK